MPNRAHSTPVDDPEEVELDLLLEGVHRRYGYDFRNYARASLRRRVRHRLEQSRIDTISELLGRILRDDTLFDSFLGDMSVSTTDMFRDPEFFLELRRQVIPLLKTYSFVKIWHAGCSTGEEVYSLAILLAEEGFYPRCQIYATDINKRSLARAAERTYPADMVDKWAESYRQSGGKRALSDYFHGGYGFIKLHESLARNVTFTYHNLVTDAAFGEMHLILCRNVFIYFDRELQNRVLQLFADSLCHRGFLCLGSKESLDFSPAGRFFEPVEAQKRIFRRIAGLSAPTVL